MKTKKNPILESLPTVAELQNKKNKKNNNVSVEKKPQAQTSQKVDNNIKKIYNVVVQYDPCIYESTITALKESNGSWKPKTKFSVPYLHEKPSLLCYFYLKDITSEELADMRETFKDISAKDKNGKVRKVFISATVDHVIKEKAPKKAKKKRINKEKNKTILTLRKQGRKEIAEALAKGHMKLKDAKTWVKDPNKKTTLNELITAPKKKPKTKPSQVHKKPHRELKKGQKRPYFKQNKEAA